MDLGLFFMPVHDPAKPFGQAMEEDRQAIILADQLGFSEAWMGEHFTARTEPIAAPMMFLATLIHETKNIRFGTGVVNLGNRHPYVIAAEAAQFDQLSGGRFMLGVGPGGLRSDAELFGDRPMDERMDVADEAIDMILACWSDEAPFSHAGAHWEASIETQIWADYGVGGLPKPLQQPHPPMAMAMVSPGGRTSQTIAERSFIPMSANFVPIENAKAQWESYSAKRDELGLPIDRDIWRVCRNILITESQAQADEIVADPEGVFSFYFRYLRGVGSIKKMAAECPDATDQELNDYFDIPAMIESCVIAGTVETVSEKLIDTADYLGPFGTLVSVGHDWDGTDLWPSSMRRLADDVAPSVSQHMDTLAP